MCHPTILHVYHQPQIRISLVCFFFLKCYFLITKTITYNWMCLLNNVFHAPMAYFYVYKLVTKFWSTICKTSMLRVLLTKQFQSLSLSKTLASIATFLRTQQQYLSAMYHGIVDQHLFSIHTKSSSLKFALTNFES